MAPWAGGGQIRWRRSLSRLSLRRRAANRGTGSDVASWWPQGGRDASCGGLPRRLPALSGGVSSVGGARGPASDASHLSPRRRQVLVNGLRFARPPPRRPRLELVDRLITTVLAAPMLPGNAAE